MAGSELQEKLEFFNAHLLELIDEDRKFYLSKYAGSLEEVNPKGTFLDFFATFFIKFLTTTNSFFGYSIKSIETMRSQPKRYYSPNDNDYLSSLIFQHKFKKNEADYIIKDILGIADEINIDTIDGYLKKLTIRKDTKTFNLVDMGYGFSQLLPMIMYPDLELDPHNDRFKKTWLLSEPEANLHPSLQSKLADLFVHLAKRAHSRFIIETHSEYIIRKLQYLIRKTDSPLKPEDVVIYYFYHPDEIPPGESQIKTITIDAEGNLSENFPPGFYDESSRIALDLWNMNASQKN